MSMMNISTSHFYHGKTLPGEMDPTRPCWLTTAGSIEEVLQINTRGNQVENDFEHVKCKCMLSILII
jgi:hypothetical protein